MISAMSQRYSNSHPVCGILSKWDLKEQGDPKQDSESQSPMRHMWPLLVLARTVVCLRPSLLRSLQRGLVDLASDVMLAEAAEGAPIAALGVDIAVKPSWGKGQGLFALRDFAEGEFVCQYSGAIKSEKEFEEDYFSGRTSGDYVYLLEESEFFSTDGAWLYP